MLEGRIVTSNPTTRARTGRFSPRVKEISWQRPLPRWTGAWSVSTARRSATHRCGIAYSFVSVRHRPTTDASPVRTLIKNTAWEAHLVGGSPRAERFLSDPAQPLPPAEAAARLMRLCNEAKELWRHLSWDLCLDCHLHTTEAGEYYMVHDSIWLTVQPHEQGMLCVGCLESRLGRQLTESDFTTAPVNAPSRDQSSRLRERLGLVPLSTPPLG